MCKLSVLWLCELGQSQVMVCLCVRARVYNAFISFFLVLSSAILFFVRIFFFLCYCQLGYIQNILGLFYIYKIRVYKWHLHNVERILFFMGRHFSFAGFHTNKTIHTLSVPFRLYANIHTDSHWDIVVRLQFAFFLCLLACCCFFFYVFNALSCIGVYC